MSPNQEFEKKKNSKQDSTNASGQNSLRIFFASFEYRDV